MGIPCPDESGCTDYSAPQEKVLALLAKQYGNQYQEINDVDPPNQSKRPTESYIVGYRIKDNKTNKLIYFILPPVADNKVRFLVRNEKQIEALGGVL